MTDKLQKVKEALEINILDLEQSTPKDLLRITQNALVELNSYIEARDGEWQPIDSAPKDGTRILGLTKYGAETIKYCDEMSDSSASVYVGWIGCEQDSTCLPERHYTYRGVRKAQHQPNRLDATAESSNQSYGGWGMSEEFTQQEVDAAIKEVCRDNKKLLDTIKELRDSFSEVLRISDRKHDAWDKAKQALDKTKDMI